MLCYNDKANHWIAALIECFDIKYRTKDYYQCLSRANHIYRQLERKYIKDCQWAHDNEWYKQQYFEQIKRFEEQEIARQQYEIE